MTNAFFHPALRAFVHLQIYLVNPNKTDVLLLIGAIYYQLGNYEQCIAFNDRCILLDPHMAEAHANLANALQQLGNFDMAVIYYQVHCNCQGHLKVDAGSDVVHIALHAFAVDNACLIVLVILPVTVLSQYLESRLPVIA